MFNRIKYIFKKDKSRQKVDNIPPVLYHRFRKLLGCACVICITGIILFAAGSGFNKSALLLYILLLSSSFAAMAFYYKCQIEYNGYTVLEGKVISKKNSGRKSHSVIWYLLKSSDGNLFSVPVSKRSVEIPLHSLVRIYAPFDVRIIESDGIYKLPNIFCHEVIPSPEGSSSLLPEKEEKNTT